jgi:hypothetical protein
VIRAVDVEVFDDKAGEWKPAGPFQQERDDFTRRTKVRLVLYAEGEGHE